MKRLRPLFGLPIALSLLPVDASASAPPPWTVLAYEAELKGYKLPNGQFAKITKADLEAAVKNFAAYPKSPLVVEHADTRTDVAELHPDWAEPRGWITELRLGKMTRNGAEVTTLEGRLAVSPEVRLSIVGDAATGTPPTWPFCSVTLGQGVDEETGLPIGAVLYSVSLTAHPRLADVPRLAAGYWYGDMDSREDTLSMLRSVFELPVTSTEAEVIASLDKLEGLLSTPDDTSGIDTDDIVESLRSALRLPALTTATETIAEVRKALTTLPSEMTSMSRGTPAHTPPTTEKPMKFLALLATFGLPPVADEETAERSILSLAQDGAAARSALAVPHGTPVAPKLAAVVTDAAELARVQPELATLRADRDARTERDRVAHVDAVCLAKGWGDDAKPALLAFAKADPKAFGEKYPLPSQVELAQRAQDAARTATAVPGSKTEAAKVPAGDETTAQKIEALTQTYARAGFELTVTDAIELLRRGETAELAAAKLNVRA